MITVYSAEDHLAADYFCDVLKLKNSKGSLSLEVDLYKLDWTLVATVQSNDLETWTGITVLVVKRVSR